MDFLLAQGITETVEIKKPPAKTEDPIGGGIKEEITVPLPTPPIKGIDDSLIDKIITDPMPIIRPIPNLPMGTITETITIPAATIPIRTTPKKEIINYEQKYGAGSTEEIKQEPNGEITIKREICDGEVHLGPFKSCLKEFTGVPAVGWIAAAAGLIVLWKWLDYRFKK